MENVTEQFTFVDQTFRGLQGTILGANTNWRMDWMTD